MNRFYKALFGTCVEIVVLAFSSLLYVYGDLILFRVLGLLLLIAVSFILFKVNYEYFESPFYKSLKYPWESEKK